jgi:anti-sigma B factor antagonist
MRVASTNRWAEWEEVGSVTVVRFLVHRVVDLQDITGLFEQLDSRVQNEGARQLVLSFRGINSFGTYAIGRLLALDKNLRARGGRLALCELTPVITEAIDLMQLRRQLHIYPTEQEALQSF